MVYFPDYIFLYHSPISCQWSLSIPPENIRKPLVFRGYSFGRVFSEVFHISKENITRLSINTLRFDVANLWSKLYFESINKETIFTKYKLYLKVIKK